MQSKRVNLEFPENSVDSTGKAILSESVSYEHEDNVSTVITLEDSVRNETQRSLDQVQHLPQVSVVAKLKQKFAPERNGWITVDFVVNVPKELLSADWRMQLFPKLMHNDSIVPLGGLNLKGANFRAKQKADSLAYEDYEGSIIGKNEYDRLFLDRKGIAKDMRKRQLFYWQIYKKEHQKVMAYYRWKNKLQTRYDRYNLQKESWRANLYHKYMRDAQYESVKLLVAGVDTTGMEAKHTHRFNKRAKTWPQYNLHREIQEKNVPRKYKDFFHNEPDPLNLSNYSTTEKDSIEIAKHRYFFDQIAENEEKEKNKEEVKKRLIPFPFETEMRLDELVDTEKDFVYYYTQSYPVTPGLKTIRIAMDGKIIATDRSSYTLPQADTLSFMISSLVQLADTTLIMKKTKLYRNLYDTLSIYPQFEPNKWDFRVGYTQGGYSNEKEVNKLMSSYRKLTVERGLQMDSVRVTSWASLDGLASTNYDLSKKKAESVVAYLKSSYPTELGRTPIRIVPRGEDWKGFIKEVRKRGDIVNRGVIAAKTQNATDPDKTEQEIRWQYKKDYRIIRQEVYPKLRRMDISFFLSRPGMVAADTIQYAAKEGYEEGLRLLMNREYEKALEILKNYPDYNTALCLACMGYNGRAYDILVKLEPNGNSEYLLAIVTQRMGFRDTAVEHLLKAVELDQQKAYRWQLDSEMINLVNRYKLQDKIEEILNRIDYMDLGLE